MSFWYLIIYFTMLIGAKYNDSPVFLLLKLTVSAVLVTWFMKTPWLLQSIFDFLAAVANIHWSAREWTFRVTLDLWVVYLGMITAYAYIKLKELGIPSLPWFPTAVKAAVGASFGAIAWFFWFELGRENKFVYNAYHPVVSFIPILGFVVLRNATPFLRSVSSRMFCFIGQISLETFILQFHVWLAADTKGILIVVPGTRWRYLNVIVTSIIFIFLSQKMSQATGQLTEFLVGKSKKPSLPPPVSSSAGGPQAGPSSSGPAKTEEAIPLLETNPAATSDVPSSSSELGVPSQADGRRPSWSAWMDRMGSVRPSEAAAAAAGGGMEGFKQSPGWKLLAIVVVCWALNLLSPRP